MRSKVAHLCCAALFTSVLAAVPASAQDKLEPFVIALGGDGLHYAALHIAKAKGYFKEEGLDVSWPDVSTGTKQVAAVMGRSADLVPTGMTQVLKAVNNGGKLVAVSTHFDVLPSTLVMSNAAIQRMGIKPGMNLDEKVRLLAKGNAVIGISSPGGTSDTMIRTTFKLRGYDPDAVLKLQPLGDGPSMLAALERGSVEGFVLQSPATDLAVQRGLAQIIIDPFTGEVKEMIDVPYTVMATSRAILAAKPRAIAAALKAHQRGVKLIHEHPDEARAILRKHFATMDESTFNAGFKSTLPGIPKSMVLTPAQVEKTMVWMNITSDKKIKGEVMDFIDVTAAKEAEASLRSK